MSIPRLRVSKNGLFKAKCVPELAFFFALPKMIYSKDEKNEKDAAIFLGKKTISPCTRLAETPQSNF